LDSRLLLKHQAVLIGQPFGDKCHRGDINIGEDLNSVGGIPVDKRPRIVDFRGSAAVLAWIPACCSSIMRSFLCSFSVTSVPGGEIDSGENSNSVGGVPVVVRTRIARFSWLGCGFGLDSRLLLKHRAVLFGRPFGDKCPWGGER
jgi:hypothetical protein